MLFFRVIGMVIVGAVSMVVEEAVVKEKVSRNTTGIKNHGQTSPHHHRRHHGSCQHAI